MRGYTFTTFIYNPSILNRALTIASVHTPMQNEQFLQLILHNFIFFKLWPHTFKPSFLKQHVKQLFLIFHRAIIQSKSNPHQAREMPEKMCIILMPFRTGFTKVMVLSLHLFL